MEMILSASKNGHDDCIEKVSYTILINSQETICLQI